MPEPTHDPMVLGGKLLSLLDESAVVATYKPALLMALIDSATEFPVQSTVPVRLLAERVTELYWPQTVAYPTTGTVLLQNQGSQAKIISAIVEARAKTGNNTRSIPESFKATKVWTRLVRRVELSLAEMPIPRLQVPFEPFLYRFDWPWADFGHWRVKTYDETSRTISLLPGVAESLVSLGALIRPFIMRWWSEKAARLNPAVEEAASMLNFEQFMFGRDRVALERIGEGLLDLQSGRCFYCKTSLARIREIDHFVPWSQSGDDGLSNLVAACRKCNSSKSSILAGPEYLERLLVRNTDWKSDLPSLANERTCRHDPPRPNRVIESAYQS